MDNSYLNNSHISPFASSLAQAKDNFAEAQANSINKISELTNIQYKDGKHSWMGIEMSPAIASILQDATSWMPSLVNNALSGGTYKHASGLYEKLNKKFKFDLTPGGQTNTLGAHKAGLRSAAAASALLIGVQPTIEMTQAFRQRTKARAELRKNLEAIIETNKNYEDNEVIKTAMERTQKIMVMGFKHAAAELPSVFTNGMFAWANHKALVKDKTNKFDNKTRYGTNDGAASFFEKVDKDLEAFEKEMKARNIDAGSYKYDEYKEKWESHNKAWHSENAADTVKTDNITQQAVGFGATVVDKILKEQNARNSSIELSKPTAYDLIMGLQKSFNDGHINKGDDISGEVAAIFHQNELDRGRSKIGEAFTEKFQPLVNRVAEVISNGELEPLALVTLVGKGEIINKRKFISADKLEELLDVERTVLKTREKTPLDDFKADLKEPEVVMKALKEALHSLKGEEKSLLVSLLPDDVLKHLGFSQKEIVQHNVKSHDATINYIKSKASELAKKSPEELKEQGLTDKDIGAVNHLSELIVSGSDKEIKSAVFDVGVKSAVRTSTLNQLLENKPTAGATPWTEAIQRSKKTKPVSKSNTAATDQVIASRKNDSSAAARV